MVPPRRAFASIELIGATNPAKRRSVWLGNHKGGRYSLGVAALARKSLPPAGTMRRQMHRQESSGRSATTIRNPLLSLLLFGLFLLRAPQRLAQHIGCAVSASPTVLYATKQPSDKLANNIRSQASGVC